VSLEAISYIAHGALLIVTLIVALRVEKLRSELGGLIRDREIDMREWVRANFEPRRHRHETTQ